MKFSKSILIGMALLANSAHAEWTVANVTGEAWSLSGLEKTVLHKGDKMGDQQIVATGKASRLELRDGSAVLTMGSGSKLKLHNQNPQQPSEPINLLYGKIRAMVTPRADNTFRIQTRSAVSGVRGTEYLVNPPTATILSAL